MDAMGGAPVPPAVLLDSCLAQAEIDGRSCAGACGEEGPEGAPELCAYIAGDVLPFYAAQPRGCRSVLASCMSACADAGGDGPFEDLSDSSEAVCLHHGFNGDCDAGYARQLAVCGGTVAGGSVRACHLLCEATFGAWRDDLDTICTEECGAEEL
jgi:hypothetical protein